MTLTSKSEAWRLHLAAQAARRRYAESLAAQHPNGVRFALRTNPNRQALASLDTVFVGAGRVTYFDPEGPTGHVVYPTMSEAILSLVVAYEVMP